LKASVQQSTMAVQTAGLQVQQAQLNLANAAIKAPFDGQIAAVNVHPGEFVGTSTAAFVLVSRSKILTFSVPPSDAPGLSNRTPVKFTYNGLNYQATITQIPAAPVGGLIPLTASLPTDLSPPLGTVGTITYSMELARGALVPLQAVQSAENTTFVFTVSKNNKVAKSTVTILAETGAFAAVTGVAVGTSVILNPPPGILVGSTVQPQASTDVQAAPGAAAAPGGQGAWSGKRAPGAAPGAAGADAGAPAGPGAGGFDPSKLTPEQRAQFQAKRKAAADAGPGAPASDAAAAPATEAPGAGARGAFDPSKLTPEQRAQFQAKRKAAADAAAAGGTPPAPTTGGQ
jgi:Spy/CpxP family protein refolding chaperone